jgi:hypothetical protein
MTNEFLSIPTSIIFSIIDAIHGVMTAMAAMMAAKAIIDRTVMSMMSYLCYFFHKTNIGWSVSQLIAPHCPHPCHHLIAGHPDHQRSANHNVCPQSEQMTGFTRADQPNLR